LVTEAVAEGKGTRVLEPDVLKAGVRAALSVAVPVRVAVFVAVGRGV
jgi:hypothetical protein